VTEVEILAIPGSLRTGSWNAALLRLAQERAPAGVRVDIWDGLRHVPPFSEDHEGEVVPAPVDELRSAIAAADALLVATPEYNGGAPGQLKNAIDWASRPYGIAAVVGKPAGVISASTGSFGGRWAQEEVRKALRLSGAAVLGEGLAVGKAAERLAETGEADPEILAGIDDVLERLVTAIAEQQHELDEALSA
jgi:chromate reductase, NAD(P)H dehydrogenase (quinone)